jgi:hypothetical protein
LGASFAAKAVHLYSSAQAVKILAFFLHGFSVGYGPTIKIDTVTQRRGRGELRQSDSAREGKVGDKSCFKGFRQKIFFGSRHFVDFCQDYD